MYDEHQQWTIRVTECAWSILIRFCFQALPPSASSEQPTRFQKCFVWVSSTACVIADDMGDGGSLDQMNILVVDENQTGLAVVKDICNLGRL